MQRIENTQGVLTAKFICALFANATDDSFQQIQTCSVWVSLRMSYPTSIELLYILTMSQNVSSK